MNNEKDHVISSGDLTVGPCVLTVYDETAKKVNEHTTNAIENMGISLYNRSIECTDIIKSDFARLISHESRKLENRINTSENNIKESLTKVIECSMQTLKDSIIKETYIQYLAQKYPHGVYGHEDQEKLPDWYIKDNLSVLNIPLILKSHHISIDLFECILGFAGRINIDKYLECLLLSTQLDETLLTHILNKNSFLIGMDDLYNISRNISRFSYRFFRLYEDSINWEIVAKSICDNSCDLFSVLIQREHTTIKELQWVYDKIMIYSTWIQKIKIRLKFQKAFKIHK